MVKRERSVIFDTAAGARRIRDEALRLEVIRIKAAIPAECGEDIAPAPARGAFRVFTPVEMVPGSTLRQRPAGYLGRASLAKADVFDRMIEEARRAHRRRHGDRVPFFPPLSPGQVAMGRAYRDLVERHDAGGMRCASLETGRGGGGSGLFIDAFVTEGRRIEAIRRRIGGGLAMELRRVRPSARGTRVAILDRVLVDQVCLMDRDIGQVLVAHRWAKSERVIGKARAALAAALDRMMGYDCVRPQNVG